jgi:hypothetical protein
MGGCASIDSSEALLIEHINIARNERIQVAKAKARAQREALNQEEDEREAFRSAHKKKSELLSAQSCPSMFSDDSSFRPNRGVPLNNNKITKSSSATWIDANPTYIRAKVADGAQTQQPILTKATAWQDLPDRLGSATKGTPPDPKRPTTAPPSAQRRLSARAPTQRDGSAPAAVDSAAPRPPSAAPTAAGGNLADGPSALRRRGYSRPQSAYIPTRRPAATTPMAVLVAALLPPAGAARPSLRRPQSALSLRPLPAAAPRAPSPGASRPASALSAARPQLRPRPLSAAARAMRPESAKAPQLVVAPDGALHNVSGRCSEISSICISCM